MSHKRKVQEGSEPLPKMAKAEVPQSLASLPPELLQMIFCHLPLVDLLLFVSPTCSTFRTVVDDPSYLHWKKLYFKYKKGIREAELEVRSLLSDAAIDGCEISLVRFIAFAEAFKGIKNRAELDALIEALSRHPLATTVSASLAAEPFRHNCARLVDEAALQLERSFWSRTAATIVYSGDVTSIQTLVRLLVGAVPRLSVLILEFFYFTATLLLALNRVHRVSPRLHYNLFYALYLHETGGNRCVFERTEFASFDGIAKHRKFVPTFEQNRIIKYDLEHDDSVRIVALAGTGKTSTLIEYCQRRPGTRFLVVFYNKAVSDRCKEDFPKNAKCRTIHSVAHEAMEVRRFMFKVHDPKVDELRKLTELEIEDVSATEVAKLLKRTIAAFVASDKMHVGMEQVPEYFTTGANGRGRQTLSIAEREKLAEEAERLWKRCADRKDGEIGISADGYLKMLQLEQRQLRDFDIEFDVLMVDEAQDCTPCVLDIVRQQQCPKIFVGDPNQQIYSFRGAVNALEIVPATKTFCLTQSFRFGPWIAYVANCCLSFNNGRQNETLVGMDKAAFLDGPQPGHFERVTPFTINKQRRKPMTIICRNNITVFSECTKITQLSCLKRLFLVGGTAGMDLPQIENIRLLAEGKRAEIKDKFISRFESLDKLEAYVTDVDPAMASKVMIVRTFGTSLRKHIANIQKCLVKKAVDADFIVTTAHKAKGMEFDVVRLADDFVDFTEVDRRAVDEEGDERNLLYVAITRAKERLVMNAGVFNLLRMKCDESFLHVVETTGVPSPCAMCGVIDGQSPLALAFQPPLAISRALVGFERMRQLRICAECAASDEHRIRYHFDAATESGVPDGGDVIDAGRLFDDEVDVFGATIVDSHRMALRPLLLSQRWEPAKAPVFEYAAMGGEQ